eukprot:TRINITY_DN42057_c0_g1_i1.p1 TRINITY_DN42057_c0_g1~~TRINITY_DN42057_c0_g1_i1.p1  ORF type:complete len:151 (-),score=11.03 TRINITY_DN42057_c0_g1_i1:180-632(-)
MKAVGKDRGCRSRNEIRQAENELLLKMFKTIIISILFLSVQAANVASVGTTSVEEAMRLTTLPCYELHAAVRNIAPESGKEVLDLINNAVRSCGYPIDPIPLPVPPRPISCPCQCTSYEKALEQCKGFSFSKCWLIGPPKCKKGQLSCCC